MLGCQAPEAKFRDFHCEQSARPSRALSRCTGILLDLAEVVGWQYGGYASTKREISLATQKNRNRIQIEFDSERTALHLQLRDIRNQDFRIESGNLKLE